MNLLKNEKLALCLMVLVSISLFQYIVTVRNGFVWDAEVHIAQDPTIREFKYVPSYFRESSLTADLSAEGSPFYLLKSYRPLLKVFYLLEYQMFGQSPYGYNVVNIALNILVVILGFLLIFDLTQDLRVAFIASLFYAVNPSRVEAVSWSYSVSNILVALFSLLTILLYHRKKQVMALICFFVAILIRETAVLVPIILILYELLIRRERSWRGYTPIVGYGIIIGLYLTVRHVVLGFTPLTNVNPWTLLNTSVVILKRFVKIFFMPDAAVAMYPLRLFDHVNGEVAISYLLLPILIVLGILLGRKWCEYLFWYLWFFIWIALAFNVGIAGYFLLAEKELYLASLGLCVVITKAFFHLPLKKILLVSCVAVGVAGQFAMTFQRTLYWKDTITLLDKLVEFAPDFYLPHYNLAVCYLRANQHQNALESFQKSLACYPENSSAYNHIGNIYYHRRQLDPAMTAWEKALQINPKNPLPYFNLGLGWETRGNRQQALNYYNRYLALAPAPDPATMLHIRQFKAQIGGKR